MKTKICLKCKIEKEISEFQAKDIDKTRYSPWCKKCFSIYCMERWKSIKLKATGLFENKCCKCGYDKNLAAMDFHHLDPSIKEYNWNRLCKRPWVNIVAELKKCILVCKNCHAELHNPNQNVDKISIKTLIIDREKIIYLKPTGKCDREGCCNDVYGTKYCSSECSHLCQRKVKRPSKENLRIMMDDMPVVAIGKKYGVSDNAIRKWARAYGILN